jgi:multiple sugar transport system permease protein
VSAAARPGLSPVAWALVGLGAAIMVAPLLWTLALSLKSNSELMRDTASAFGGPYTLENYRAILQGSVLRWLLNSFIVSLGTTLGVLVLRSQATLSRGSSFPVGAPCSSSCCSASPSPSRR